jgi:hypothetical protein
MVTIMPFVTLKELSLKIQPNVLATATGTYAYLTPVSEFKQGYRSPAHITFLASGLRCRTVRTGKFYYIAFFKLSFAFQVVATEYRRQPNKEAFVS